MTEITCTKCGKSITQCKCNNTFLNQTATIQEDVLSQRIRIKQLEEENAKLKEKIKRYEEVSHIMLISGFEITRYQTLLENLRN